MNFNSIPTALRDQPNWVCRRGKIPINPRTGQAAKAGQPDTWAHFEEAVQAAPRYDGIGFEFDGSGIIGIDFDHCIENGQLAPWVQDWVSRFDSYTELSPSGTGIHILCQGSLHGRPAVKRKEVEIYDRARYFTMTGRTFGTPRPLRDAQAALDALYEAFGRKDEKARQAAPVRPLDMDDSTLIKKIEQSAGCARFAPLWRGDTGGYGSHSEADLALCSILAFWTRCNADQMDRLFRSSGLMRDKWDRRQSGSTYGALTIQKAISQCTQVYEPRTAYTVSVGSKKSPQSCTLSNYYPNFSGQSLTLENLRVFLKEAGLDVRNNLLTKEIDVTGDLGEFSRANAANVLPAIISDRFKQGGAKNCTSVRVKELMSCIADERRYNPVEDYLCGLTWDGKDRLPYLYDILGIGQQPIYQTYVKKWLWQCVALAMNDETDPISAEGILVLLGAQGCGKTSFFRKLCPNPRWFAEGCSLDTTDKDSMIRALGSWICELGELDATTKKEQPALKAFLTAAEDRIRLPYDISPTRTPRRTSFCGTVNDETFLRDSTGSRRYWTIPLETIDKNALFSLHRADVDQIWAQMFELWKKDHNGFRLNNAQLAQLQTDNESFTAPLPYETELRELFDLSMPPEQWEWWSAGELSKLGMLVCGRGDAAKVGKALSKCAREFQADGHTERERKIVRGIQKFLLPIRRFHVS